MDNVLFAGFWRRFAGLLIDGLIVAIFFWLLSVLLPSTDPMENFSLKQWGNDAAEIMYGVLFLSSGWQATPGKRIMKVYIARAEDGGRISLLRAFCRQMILGITAILMTCVSINQISTMLPDVQTYQQQLTPISEKIRQKQPLTADEQQVMDDFAARILASQAQMSKEDADRFVVIDQKKKRKEALTPEEEQLDKTVNEKITSSAMKFSMIGFAIFCYLLLIALMIGMTKQKTGLHDLICKTRAVRGRPGAPMLVGAAAS